MDKRGFCLMKTASYIPLLILTLFILYGCSDNCGNGIVDNGETFENCCTDIGCPGQQTCEENICTGDACADCQFLEGMECKSYECCADSHCESSEECENNKCTEIICGECEYAKNHQCLPQECCSDSDCNDEDKSTIDSCVENSCKHVFQSECINGDDYCPLLCIKDTDKDCDDNFYTYYSSPIGVSIEYPADWEPEEDVINDFLYISNQDGEEVNDSISIDSYDLEEYLTLDDYTENHKKWLLKYWGVSKFDEGRKTTLLDNPAYMVTFDYRIKANIIQSTLIWTIADDRIISVMYWADKEAYDGALLRKMTNSLKLNKADYDPTNKPFLWRIEGEKPSYLYGTIHMNDKSLFLLPTTVVDAIKEADAVYTEVVIDDYLTASVEKIAKTDIPLDELIPEKLYNRTQEYLWEKGLGDLNLLDGIEVWALVQFIDLINSYGSQDSSSITALDSLISGIATENDKEIGGLENGKESASIYDNLELEDQLLWLENTLDFIDQYKKVGGLGSFSMLESYLTGKEERIMPFLVYDEEDPLDQKLYDLIYVKRNKQMAEKIKEKLENKDRSYFFAVGVGHMVGEENIIDILEGAGYKVTRVAVSNETTDYTNLLGEDEPMVQCKFDKDCEYEWDEINDFMSDSNKTEWIRTQVCYNKTCVQCKKSADCPEYFDTPFCGNDHLCYSYDPNKYPVCALITEGESELVKVDEKSINVEVKSIKSGRKVDLVIDGKELATQDDQSDVMGELGVHIRNVNYYNSNTKKNQVGVCFGYG